MLFSRKKEKVETPFGVGRIVGNMTSVPWVRWNGIMLDLEWPTSTMPDQKLATDIRENLDYLINLAMDRLGIHEFPPEMGTVIPCSVSLAARSGTWALDFESLAWDDGIWGVIFDGHEIIRDYDGD